LFPFFLTYGQIQEQPDPRQSNQHYQIFFIGL
jgi:hypothetical protein